MIAGALIPAAQLVGDDIAILQEVQYFLTREAWLLDHEKFEQWLALLDPQIRYFAPVRSSVQRTAVETFQIESHVAHFDETLQTLAMRVKRLGTNQAWAEDPRSRVRRFVSNPVLLAHDENTLLIGSNILIHREGADERDQKLSAYREDRLVHAEGGGLLLKARTIWIDHLVVRPLSIFF